MRRSERNRYLSQRSLIPFERADVQSRKVYLIARNKNILAVKLRTSRAHAARLLLVYRCLSPSLSRRRITREATATVMVYNLVSTGVSAVSRGFYPAVHCRAVILTSREIFLLFPSLA